MKKKNFKLAIVCLGFISGCYFYQQKDQKLNDLVQQNIEALASGEGSSSTFCYGIGSVDCLGNKVEMKFTGVR